MNNNYNLEQLPAHDILAERSILGSLLLDSKISESVFINQKLDYNLFYVPSHQVIFSAMEYINRQDKPIDMVTLGNRLSELNLLKM